MGDGLTDSEITRILFKKYLNFPTTHHGKRFYDETLFENNTNLFHESIMTEMPTKIPNFVYASASNVVELLTSNNSGFNVDASWVETKIHTASNINEKVSKFEYDTGDNTILRLNKIKLDYLGNNSAAFGCTDKSGNNVLKNLIPNSYSAYPGYSLSLNYIDAHVTELTPTNWLSMRPDTLKWGAPLFDPANGTVVFYDVSAAKPNQVFDPSLNTTDAPTFYLTATKYVGAMGISGGTGGTVTVSGGSFTNDHLDFDTVPGITSLAALDTTLSGEIVSVVGGGTANNDHLDFEDTTTIDLTELDTTTISTTHVGGDMTISKKLGIGNSTTTPEFSLDVHDSTDLSGINGYYLDGSNANINPASNMTSSITIRAQNDILSGGKIIAESDHRIKKDIVDLSEIESLDLVRNLRPKKYHYIDSTQKTRELVYGYIAQEVKEVLPSAVQHIRGAIPSIFELAQASRSKNNNKGTMLTFHHYNTQNLDPSCEVLKLVDAGQNDHLVHITKIVDTRRLEIEEHVEEGPIFVYGEEVNDFHVLSKDYINVVAVSALQQMDAHVTQLQEENRALRGELHEIKSILQNNGMI